MRLMGLPFAVELAKLTLNIAKKIAYDERRETALELLGQVEMDIDPTLPLDNLDENIVCADALFTKWPEVDAIVGNPPFLGGTKIRAELGSAYVQRLQGLFPEVHGRADFCAYWFRLAHDNLRTGGRAGLVATNTVREGNTLNASTAYVVANGGAITNAVSSRMWPGEAVVKVSMVNWIKGPAPGPHRLVVDDQVYERSSIAPHLRLHVDLSEASAIVANRKGSTQGVHIGTKACQLSRLDAIQLVRDAAARPFVRPVAHGKHLLAGRLATNPDYIVDMSDCADLASAKTGGRAFEFIERSKLPEVQSKRASFQGWHERWWQAWRPRAAFFLDAANLRRLLVRSKHAARPVFAFLDRAFLPTDSLQMFAFEDDYAFGILQSNIHWKWAVAQGSKIKDDTRYTMTVWTTFPWPQEVSEAIVANVAAVARELRDVRRRIMDENEWSLRALYQAAEVAGTHPLKDAQAALDKAVAEAYGMPDDLDITEFLLDLNRCLAQDEEEGVTVDGPGLPADLDPKDPRWFSEDCIEPPPLDA